MLTTSQLTCSSLMLNIPMIKSFISEIHYFTPFYDTLCVIVFQTGSWFFKFLSEIALKTMWLVWFFSKTILETQIINIPSIELIIFNEKTIIRKVTVFADILFLMIKSGVTKWYFHLKESVKRMIFHRSAFHANVPFVSSFYTLVFRSFKRGNTVEKMTRKWSGVVTHLRWLFLISQVVSFQLFIVLLCNILKKKQYLILHILIRLVNAEEL